ncbi:MAG: glycosyltransferase [Nanoarchaeota archaeon]|nr:glycosyltransferase [Nanoarchaeota archaeon]MBU1051164.1 glycosyltransferase [Nanoarchaeota archaeon]
MKKRICFFSIGFAFNRLVRMKYYEKIFPKEVEIFLFTTDKYKGKEKDHYQFQWDLKRTKIHVEEYGPATLPFRLRNFCNENKIERLVNLGYFTSCLLLFYATIFSSRDFIMNHCANIGYKIKSFKDVFVVLFRYLAFVFFLFSANKTIFVDYGEYRIYEKLVRFHLLSLSRISYLPAPVNTELFIPKNRKATRKKLKLPLNKKIVIFVDRVTHEKGSDLFKEVVESNQDILFVIIGRIIDKEYMNLKTKNYIHIEKKSSKELVDYYNAADMFYHLHRVKRAGIDLTTVESLSVGTPAIIPFREGIPGVDGLFQVPFSLESANKTLRNFFKLSEKQKKAFSKKTREYAKKYYSDDANKEGYIKSYLA